MTFQELDDFLKNRGIQTVGSLDVKDLMEMFLGIKGIDPALQAKIEKARLDTTTALLNASNNILNESKGTKAEDVIKKDLLGISDDKNISDSISNSREKIRKAIEDVANNLSSFTSSLDFKKIIDDIVGLNNTTIASMVSQTLKNNQNLNVNQSGLKVSSTLGNVTFATAPTQTGNTNNTNQNIDLINAIKTLSSKIDDSKKNTRFVKEYTLSEDLIKQLGSNLQLDKDAIKEFVEDSKRRRKELDKGEGIQKPDDYYTGPQKFKLDRESITDIVRGLSLDNKQQNELLKSIYGGIDKEKTILEKFVDSFNSSFNLGDIGNLIILGLAGIIGGKGVLKVLDGIFGTNLVGLFEDVTKPLKGLTGYLADALKFSLYLLSIAKQGMLMGIKFLSNPFSFIKETTALGSAAAAKAVGANATQKAAQTAAERTAAAAAVRAARNTAAKGAKTAAGQAALSTAKAGMGKAVATTAAKTGIMAFGKGLLMSLFKKIPIIGGVIDLGLAIKGLMEGDYWTAGLRLISSVANFCSIFPPFAPFGIGISLVASLLDDMMTAKAGGDPSKKTGVFFEFINKLGSLISDWAKMFTDWVYKKFKSVLGIGDDNKLEVNPNTQKAINSVYNPSVGIGMSSSKKEESKPKPVNQSAKKEEPKPEPVKQSDLATPEVKQKAKEITPPTEPSKEQNNVSQQTENSEDDKRMLSMIPTELKNQFVDTFNAQQNFMSDLMSKKSGSIGIKDLANSESAPLKKSLSINESSMRNLSESITTAVKSITPVALSMSGGGGGSKNNDLFLQGSRDPIFDMRSDWWNILSKRRLA